MEAGVGAELLGVFWMVCSGICRNGMLVLLSMPWDGESTFRFSSKPTKLESLSSMRSIFLSLHTV